MILHPFSLFAHFHKEQHLVLPVLPIASILSICSSHNCHLCFHTPAVDLHIHGVIPLSSETVCGVAHSPCPTCTKASDPGGPCAVLHIQNSCRDVDRVLCKGSGHHSPELSLRILASFPWLPYGALPCLNHFAG